MSLSICAGTLLLQLSIYTFENSKICYIYSRRPGEPITEEILHEKKNINVGGDLCVFYIFAERVRC